MNKYSALFDVFRKGYRLKNPEGLKKAQLWVGFLTAVITAAHYFGVDLQFITSDMIEKFGLIAVSVVGILNIGATAATTRKVGLPGLEPKSMPAPREVDADVWEASDPTRDTTEILKEKSEGYTKEARALMKYLNMPQIKAFLMMIRDAEGTPKPEHYFVMFNYVEFTDVSDKPRRVIKAGGRYSSAAGAYQINNATWDDIQRKLKLPNFQPLSQDIAAVQLLVWDKSIPSILGGDIKAAIKLESNRWASLPGNDYGQPTRKILDLLASYKSNLLGAKV